MRWSRYRRCVPGLQQLHTQVHPSPVARPPQCRHRQTLSSTPFRVILAYVVRSAVIAQPRSIGVQQLCPITINASSKRRARADPQSPPPVDPVAGPCWGCCQTVRYDDPSPDRTVEQTARPFPPPSQQTVVCEALHPAWPTSLQRRSLFVFDFIISGTLDRIRYANSYCAIGVAISSPRPSTRFC